MIKQPVPSSLRWLAGGALVVTLTLATGLTAWAAQPTANDQAMQSQSVSSDMTALDLPAPAYPKDANAKGIDGKVVMVIDVAADGSVKSARVETSEPSGIFDAAALEAVKEWKFNPATKNGKAIGSKVRVPITFKSLVATKPGDKSMAVPQGKNPDPSAYDWVEYDLASNEIPKSMHCDVIRTNIAHAETGYCGILKK